MDRRAFSLASLTNQQPVFKQLSDGVIRFDRVIRSMNRAFPAPFRAGKAATEASGGQKAPGRARRAKKSSVALSPLGPRRSASVPRPGGSPCRKRTCKGQGLLSPRFSRRARARVAWAYRAHGQCVPPAEASGLAHPRVSRKAVRVSHGAGAPNPLVSMGLTAP
jgi:hypothetical protein